MSLSQRNLKSEKVYVTKHLISTCNDPRIVGRMSEKCTFSGCPFPLQKNVGFCHGTAQSW
jgi:hypothetical protein